MKRQLAVSLLTLAVGIISATNASLAQDCEFAASRRARDILQKHVYEPAERLGYTMPSTCPLNAENDVLRLFEENKREIRRRKWECKIFGKQFEAEGFLDKHFVNRHLHSHVPENSTTCLASLCDILRCEGEHWKPPEPKRCNKHKMQHLKHRCNMLLHKCFPSEESEAVHHLQMDLSHEFCQPLSCNPADYAHVLEVPSKNSRVWYILGCVVLLVVLAVYYISMYLTYGGASQSADLVRRRPNEQGGMFAYLFSRTKPKTY